MKTYVDCLLVLLNCRTNLPPLEPDDKVEQLAEKITRINKKFIQDDAIIKKVEHMLNPTYSTRPKKKPFKLDLNMIHHRGIFDADSKQVHSVRSMREGEGSISSFRKPNYRSPKKMALKKQPRPKFEFMASSDLTRSTDAKKEGRKTLRENFKVMFTKKGTADGRLKNSIVSQYKVALTNSGT